MPIITRLLVFPNPQITLPPARRRCFLCHCFGAYSHGTFTRLVPGSQNDQDLVEISRFLCLHCERTFSLLPRFLVRRIRAPLPLLLYIAQARKTWWQLFDLLGVAWNTLWAWKKLGKALLQLLPELLAATQNWSEFSEHLSHWQYPNLLRKHHPTIP